MTTQTIDDLLRQIIRDTVRDTVYDTFNNVLLEQMQHIKHVEQLNDTILSHVSDVPKPRAVYLNAAAAGVYLSRSAWTIRQLCIQGDIKGVKDSSGRWKIPRTELDRLLSEGVPILAKRRE